MNVQAGGDHKKKRQLIPLVHYLRQLMRFCFPSIEEKYYRFGEVIYAGSEVQCGGAGGEVKNRAILMELELLILRVTEMALRPKIHLLHLTNCIFLTTMLSKHCSHDIYSQR